MFAIVDDVIVREHVGVVFFEPAKADRWPCGHDDEFGSDIDCKAVEFPRVVFGGVVASDFFHGVASGVARVCGGEF